MSPTDHNYDFLGGIQRMVESPSDSERDLLQHAMEADQKYGGDDQREYNDLVAAGGGRSLAEQLGL